MPPANRRKDAVITRTDPVALEAAALLAEYEGTDLSALPSRERRLALALRKILTRLPAADPDSAREPGAGMPAEIAVRS